MELFSSSSSSSDDDVGFFEPVYRENRRIPVRIKHFVENTVNNYSDKEFQNDFRVTRETFNILKDKLSPYLKRAEGSTGRCQVPVDYQLLSILWLLATPDSYRSVGSRFDMAKSTLFNCFTRVVTALNQIAPEIIKWPSSEDRRIIKRQFQNIRNLSGVVGAVDGTYVPIKAPQDNPEVYVNRKCFYGMTIQCICTPNLKFIDCFTGYPSSVSDNRIFRNSDIFNEFSNNNNAYFEGDEFIIGDKAYPITKWCIHPYIERGNVTAQQRNFNSVHASTRQVIERSFALLFGRFRRLRYLDMNRTDMIPATIIAACVLHNICLMNPDELLNVYVAEGTEVLNNINQNAVANIQVEVLPRKLLHQEGMQKRDNLAAGL